MLTLNEVDKSNNLKDKRALKDLNNSYSSKSSGLGEGPEFVSLINGLIKDYCDENELKFDDEVSTKTGSPLDLNNVATKINTDNLFGVNDFDNEAQVKFKKSESFTFCSYRNFSRFESKFKNNDVSCNVKNNTLNHKNSSNSLISNLKLTENLSKNWKHKIGVVRENSINNLSFISNEVNTGNNYEHNSYSNNDVSQFYNSKFNIFIFSRLK